MEVLIARTLEALLFPPGLLLLTLLTGLLLLKRFRRIGLALLWVGVVIGYVVSTPFFAQALTGSLETYPPLSAVKLTKSPAQAIVTLAGDRYSAAPEYLGDTVGTSTLVRLRYAAYLHRLTGLPILVSGGAPFGEAQSLAALMAKTLRDDFGITDVWLEDRSRTTGENAIFSQLLLKQKSIETVFLVTHAWHMPRSVDIFERSGLHVIAAPTQFTYRRDEQTEILDWLPSASAIRDTRWALHELVGRLWYLVRY